MKKLFMCDAKNKSEHCLEDCLHGRPHIKSRLPDANCERLVELCGLSNSKRRVKVHCKRVGVRELKKMGYTEMTSHKEIR